MNIRNDINIDQDTVQGAPGAARAGAASAETKKPPMTGELRGDIEILKGGKDENGKPRWVIFDPVSGNYYKISEKDSRVISHMTGNMEIGKLNDKLKDAGLDVDPQEVLKLLSFLNKSNLMKASYRASEARAIKTRQIRKKMFWNIMLSSYLFIRLPLLSPDRFLKRTLGTARNIINRWTLTVVMIVAGTGYFFLIISFHKFKDAFIRSISIQGLLRYSIAVVCIKIIHEFAHAYTARHYGCRVRKMGVAFIVFFPRLYIDITDTWRLSDRKKRFTIDSSGIFAELLIGGFAALVWANTSPGPANTVAYYIFAVSILNTVFVNGNPFIRYDGYYMLMDMVNIDNLQKRGIEFTKSLWRRHLFGLPVPKDQTRGWRRQFLLIYSICAFLYRIFLYTSIILIVYFKFFKALGILLLTLEIYLLLLKPLAGEIKFLIANRAGIKNRNAWLSLVGVATVFIVLSIPMPWKIATPCEIKPAASHAIYAQAGGFLSVPPPPDGKRIKKGEIIIKQENPHLEWDIRKAIIKAELERVKLDQAQAHRSKLGQVAVRRENLKHSRSIVSELERKKQLLRTASSIDGKFALFQQNLREGKWVMKGELVGEVFKDDQTYALAYVEEEDVKFLRSGDRVSVILGNSINSYPGKIVGINPIPAELAPGPLLRNFGGPIIATESENGKFKPISSYYQVKIELSETSPEAGRTGIAKLTKYASVSGNIARKVFSVLQRELSF